MNKRDNQFDILKIWMSGEMTDDDIERCDTAGFTSMELEDEMCSNCAYTKRCNELAEIRYKDLMEYLNKRYE